MSWQLWHLSAVAIVAVVAVFSARRNADKLTVTVNALRVIAKGQLFSKAVARCALRDIGEIDEEPDA